MKTFALKGKEMQKSITEARNKYVPVAAEAAMLYFLAIELCNINHMYQYSLDSFLVFFFKALETAPQSDDLSQRVDSLRRTLRMTIYTWLARGLFKADIRIFLTMLTFQLMRNGVIGTESGYSEETLTVLLRGLKGGMATEDNPIEWLPESAWQSISALGEAPGFENFVSDVQESSPRFREWFNHITPETEKLPLDWRELDKTPFLKLLVVRAQDPS